MSGWPKFGEVFGRRFGAAFGQGGGASVNYLLNSQFTIDVAAPMPVSQAVSPGPGLLKKFKDTGDKVTQNGGEFLMVGRIGAADPAYYFTQTDGSGFSRAAGLVLLFKLRSSAFFPIVGWSTSTTVSDAAILYGAGFDVPTTFAHSAAAQISADVSFDLSRFLDFVSLLQPTGGMLICNNRLLWVFASATTTPLYPAIMTNAATNTEIDDVAVTQLNGAFSVAYGLATERKAAPIANDVISCAEDCFITFDMTYATGIIQDVMIRRVDDDNCYILRFDQAGGTIKLYDKTAGVETELASSSTTQTNGATVRLNIRCIGSYIICNLTYLSTVSYTAAYARRTATTAKISRAGAEFASYPIDITLPPNVLNPTLGFFPYGDSKTAGQGDTDTPPAHDAIGYPYRLRNLLSGKWAEMPTRIGKSGWTVCTGASNFASSVDADIASRMLKPGYVLFNAGVNDITGAAPGVLPNQATFETALTYILTAFHTRWPDAVIGVALIWYQGFDAASTTLNTYISNVIAACSPWAVQGPDETIVLKGSDNGATNMADPKHPNGAGYAAMAAAWKSTLGMT